MTIDFNIEANICPKDDFYLQWCYIYWWQVKFNLKLMVDKAMEDFLKLIEVSE